MAITGTAFLGSAPRDREGALRAARRHSRRVRMLRTALPVAAGLVVAAIAAAIAFDSRILLAEIDADSVGISSNKIVMQRPRFTGYGLDAAGRQKGYEVSAVRAEQNLAQTHEVDLFGLKARMSIRDDGWAELDADQGHLNNKTQILNLANDIHIVTDLDDRARLSQARVDFAGGEISTQHPVRLEFSRADLDAGAMHLYANGDRAVFTGGVKMTLKPDPAAGVADSPNRIGNP